VTWGFCFFGDRLGRCEAHGWDAVEGLA
jgi:hypothetical protein